MAGKGSNSFQMGFVIEMLVQTIQAPNIARRTIPMKQTNFKVYGYPLESFWLCHVIVAATQLLWITLAYQ